MTDDDVADPRGIGVPRDGYWCGDQEIEVPEDEALPLYECSNCSETTTERKCENCKRFKARSEELACPDCEEKLDLDVLTTDHDGRTIRFADFVADAPAYAQREAERREQAAKERAEKDAAAKIEREQHSRPIPWSHVREGDVLVKPAPDAWEKPYSLVLWRHELSDGRIVATTYEYSHRTAVFDSTDEVLVCTDADIVAEQHADAADEPFATMTRLPDGSIDIASSPQRAARVELGHAPKSGALLPVIEISVMGGSMINRIVVLHDPASAVPILDTIEQAARDYAALRGIEADPDADVALEIDEDAGWLSSDFHASGTVQIGADAWTKSRGDILHFVVNNNNVTVTDANLILAAVAAARARLGHLTLIPKVTPSQLAAQEGR